MSADPELVAALETALRVDPNAVPIRLHLTKVLYDGTETDAAWAQCQQLLVMAPGDLVVLGLAAKVAAAKGLHNEASAYDRLIRALSASEEVQAVPGTQPPPIDANGGAIGDVFGDDADMFLRDVLREYAQEHVTLADVGGLQDVKRRIETSFLAPMRNPELRLAYGKSLRGGLLLWGPPGCGKTFVARAIAGELGAAFISVGLHEVLDMWLGNSEKNVHAFFEAARRARPSVLFFDEIDAIGRSRTRNDTSGALRNVIAQLLTELDGLGSDNEGVFVLAATNQPWDVDPALRRPGRFDRMIAVLPPDAEARQAIVEAHLRNRPVGTVDLAKIAGATEGFSGADLRMVCESATERALEDAMRTGQLEPISQRHLELAVRDTKPSVAPWMETAKNFVDYANDDGSYDDLAQYLRRRGRR
jgi:SpoVK/Ycf46/Vps4 family AAA+-type ATPase